MSPEERQNLFDHVVSDHRGSLVGVCRAYAGPVWEDLLQEVFLQIWKGLPQFEGQSELSTWAYRVAINTGLMWRRAYARRQKSLSLADHSIEPPSGNHTDVRVLLDRFIETLDGGKRALLAMQLEGLSIEQMSEVLEVPQGTIRVRLHRLSQQVNAWMGEQS
ncbi:MAG: RNA polymerase sigma factor [Planctomycetota bacterium]